MAKKKISEAAVAPFAPTGAPHTVQASTFKATCLELMDEIEASGFEVVVTKHGRPVVKVGPVEPSVPSPLGFLRGTVVDEGDLVSPDHDAWSEAVADPLHTDRK